MPLATTAYNTNIDSSGLYTAPATGLYMVGNVSGSITSAIAGVQWATAGLGVSDRNTGTAFYNTSDGCVQIVNGDISIGATGGWVTLTPGVRLTVSGNLGCDTASFIYNTSRSMETYIYVDSAEEKQERMKRQLQQIMKSNLVIKFGSTRHSFLRNKVSDPEIKARDTLRDLISEKEWRGYLTNGFVIVKSDSGKFYQVFNDQRHIKVYQKGKLTDEICIHTDSETNCPPTDHILNMMVLIKNDEQIIWTKGVGNVYNKNGTGLGIGNNIVQGNIALASAGYMEHLCVDNTYQKLNLFETYKKLKVA